MTQPRLLGGRYQLDTVVGRGGMAEVYRARDIRLDRQVAVKTLRADMARDPTFQARFRREAQSAASLNHPAIIAVYDTGEDTDPATGVSVPYIVMEYVEGRTLRELVQADRRLLPERAAEIVDGTLRALDYSHRAGIVHRDIKPANVMLTRTGEVKVMDFGIARALSDNQVTMTQTAQVIGTAQYLSPEQARGERVDARSDIYSTGCMFYELLTGRPPFSGDSPVAIAYQHVREYPPPPSQIDPEIPAWADAIVARAMAKDPADRYQQSAEMRADIQRALSGMPVAAPAMTAPPTEAMSRTQLAPATNSFPPANEEEGKSRGRGKTAALWTVLGILIIGGAAAAAWFLFNGDKGTPPVPELVAKTRSQAATLLKKNDLTPHWHHGYSSDQKHGLVYRTDPAAGANAPQNGVVDVWISKGQKKVTVPSVRNQSRDDAQALLKKAGLQVDVNMHASSTVRKGYAITTKPKAGSSVVAGDTVSLYISSGPATIQVPNVLGKDVSDATSTLEDKGFRVHIRKQEYSGAPAGQVFRQDPTSGSSGAKGDTVTIYVATAPQTTSPTTGPPTTEPTGTPTATPTDGHGGPPTGFPTLDH